MRRPLQTFRGNIRNIRSLEGVDLYLQAKEEIFKELSMLETGSEQPTETVCRFYDCPAGGTFSLHEKFIIRTTVEELNRSIMILDQVCQRYRRLQPRIPARFMTEPFLSPDEQALMLVRNLYVKSREQGNILSILDKRSMHNCLVNGHTRSYVVSEHATALRGEYARILYGDNVADPVTRPVYGPITFPEYYASLTAPLIPPMMAAFAMTGATIASQYHGIEMSQRDYNAAFVEPQHTVCDADRDCTNFEQDPRECVANYLGSTVLIGDEILYIALTPSQRAMELFKKMFHRHFREGSNSNRKVFILFNDICDSIDKYSMVDESDVFGSEHRRE